MFVLPPGHNPEERTLAIAKPHIIRHKQLGTFTNFVEACGNITGAILLNYNEEAVRKLYPHSVDKPYWDRHLASLLEGPVMVYLLAGPDIIRRWRECLGPTDPARARTEAPGTVRAILGESGPWNAGHGSDSEEDFQREFAIIRELLVSP
jgi:nucleoside-diphosphate kinase